MSPRQERQIRVEGVLREKPDLHKVARALIEMVRQEAEAEATSPNEEIDADVSEPGSNHPLPGG